MCRDGSCGRPHQTTIKTENNNMRHLNKIATAFCGLALGLVALSGCEGADLYENETPDWLAEKIDSINAAKAAQNQGIVLPADMHEDVYSFGNTDFSSGWWSAFSKDYVIPNGKKWYAQFNLNINPDASTKYYKNFALVITNDAHRGDAAYKEYGAFRYDATNDTAKFNSQWGDYLPFKYTSSTLMLAPNDNNVDANIQKLGGKVTLVVDRSNPDSFKIEINNGTAIKTYNMPHALPNINGDATDTNIRCFIAVEGSYIDFLSSNVEPVGGYTSALDKQPVSMVLNNVPDEVAMGTPLETAMQNVSATVTYEEGVTATVPADQLYFVSAPDMSTEGEKNLVVVYNKTFKGEAATKPISAQAKFKVVLLPTSIEVTTRPTYRRYAYYSSAATSDMTDRTLAFDPTGMVVTGTFPDGTTAAIDNSKLTFSSIPASEGTHTVTITRGKAKTTVNVKVSASTATTVTPSPTTLGATDNTTAWWGAHLDKDINVPLGETRHFAFTNYAGANNWSNWVVVLRNAALAEYAVVRSDNYGWGNGYSSARTSGGQADWATWLAAMNGAKVDLYVTNVGNGTADVQAVMHGTDGKTYTQYYLGISTVDPSDLNVDFTVDNCHLVFGSSSSAKRHYVHRR
jgi:hypothetical protein